MLELMRKGHLDERDKLSEAEYRALRRPSGAVCMELAEASELTLVEASSCRSLAAQFEALKTAARKVELESDHSNHFSNEASMLLPVSASQCGCG